MKERMEQLLKQLREDNPGQIFELHWQDGVSPGGWIDVVDGDKKIWVYSTNIMDDKIVVNR